MADIIGTDLAETLAGSASDDSITASGGGDNVLAGSGNDAVFGGEGNDYLSGESGNDLIYGENGDDTIFGGEDNDTIFGGISSDVIYGEAGNDSIGGGFDNDLIQGGDGDDTLRGGRNNDTIQGGEGNDLIFGGMDGDSLRGGSGDDEITGGGGDDILRGGAGNDNLSGGDGDDTIYGGLGSNTLTGGAGTDSFIITNNDTLGDTPESFTITDFADGDIFDISAYEDISGFGGLDIEQDGDNAVINLGGGKVITISDTSTSDISSSDFEFVEEESTGGGGGGGGGVSLSKNFTLTAADDLADGTVLDATLTNTITTSDANFNAGDTIESGAANDTLSFTDAANIVTADLANKTGIDVIALAANSNQIALSDTFVNASDGDSVELANGAFTITSLNTSNVNSARDVVIGGTGAVTLTAGVDNRVVIKDGVDGVVTLGANNDDTVEGGTGNDSVNLSSADDVDVDMGSGSDTVSFNSAVFAGVPTQLDGGDGTDTIIIFGASDPGSPIDIRAGTLPQFANLSGFERAIAGDNLDHFFLLDSEISYVEFGKGVDFASYYNADFSGSDTVDGGTGAVLGDYSTYNAIYMINAADISAADLQNLTNIQAIYTIAAGNNLVISDAFVISSGIEEIMINVTNSATINTSDVDASRDVIVSGSGAISLAAGVDNRILIRDGDDGTIVTLGAKNDDTVVGGTGNDEVIYSSAAAANINLGNGDDTLNFDITLITGTPGAVVGGNGTDVIRFTGGDGPDDVIDLSGLATGFEVVTVTDNLDYIIVSNSETNSITTGKGSDLFGYLDANFTSADTLDGGAVTVGVAATYNYLYFANAANISTSDLQNKTNFQVISLAANGNQLVISDDFVESSGTHFLVIDNDTFTITNLNTSDVDTGSNYVYLNGTGEVTLANGVNNSLYISENTDAVINGGSGNDTITGQDGDETFTGNGGADVLTLSTGSDVAKYLSISNGAAAGQNTGYDVISSFQSGTDKIQFGGALNGGAEDIDDIAGSDGGFALSSGGAAATLTTTDEAVFMTGLADSDLIEAGFTNLLAAINNLGTGTGFVAAQNDDALVMVQAATKTAFYIFIESEVNNTAVTASELRLLGIVNAQLVASDFELV